VADDPWSAHLLKVGAFIREQRRMVQLSQRELARAAGLSDTYLSQLERGLHEPSIRALKAIAKGLNISAEQLISLTASMGAGGTADDDAVEVDTEAAIRSDTRLSEPQKLALLAVLASYVAENAAD